MKLTKLVSVLCAAILAMSVLAGCGQSASNEQQNQSQSAESQSETTSRDSSEQEAGQLLSDLTGTYQELFPVLFSEQYDQTWLDDSAAIVGEANAASAVEMLKGSVSGTIWGEDAIQTYGEEGGSFYCGWMGDLAELTIEGEEMMISGADANGKELFSSTYRYSGKAGDLYVFESDDADAGDFKYFAFLPDTPDSTYHIEFRYGSDDTDLGEWMAGAYAYWMAAGIPTEHPQALVQDCIKLFCDENLGQEE